MRTQVWLPVLVTLTAAPAVGAQISRPGAAPQGAAPSTPMRSTQRGNFRFFPGIGAVPQGKFESGSSFVFTPGVGFVPAGETRSSLFQFVPGVGFVPRSSTFTNPGEFVFVSGVGFVPRSALRDARLARRFHRFRMVPDVGFVPVGSTVNVAGRPFVEAQVIRILPSSVVVRFPANGVLVTRSFPLGEVFFLRNGVLATAVGTPGALGVGEQVLVAPAAVRAAVAGSRQTRRFGTRRR